MIDFQSRRARWIALVVLALAVLPTLWFGLRTYRSYVLLQSAYAQGVPKLGNLRGWMTLGYVATHYNVPAESLGARLNLPPAANLDASLKSLAEQEGISPFDCVQRVQQAVAKAGERESTRAARNMIAATFSGLDH